MGPWGAVIFIIVYALAALLLVPGSVLTLGAGALFGVGMGSLLVSFASTLAAGLAFLIARYMARDWVAAKVESSPVFKAINLRPGHTIKPSKKPSTRVVSAQLSKQYCGL